jgi:2-polyprenyl-6-hydroxyphenyl methylase/3-demethylubiquinone-9 3-methyltransferase
MIRDDARADGWASEVRSGARFEFGRNWSRFLRQLNDDRISEATAALKRLAGGERLRARSFIDVGSGSGLSSLCALRLGATRVHSFDFDPASVECALELRRRFSAVDGAWTIEQGSALDVDYLRSLGKWDTVYSWGVLHHTGRMWTALNNVTALAAPEGRLIVALYNDQGLRSRAWGHVKALYNHGRTGRALVTAAGVPALAAAAAMHDVISGRHPAARYRSLPRGMSPVHDWLDWLGGYPFEVARPAAVVNFFNERSFDLVRLNTVGGRLGCNEFVFDRRC